MNAEIHVLFGRCLDEASWPESGSGVLHAGPKAFLAMLESLCGLPSPAQATDYLRIEQYRQTLLQYQAEHPNVFYAASLQADAFATATALLEHRDRLLLHGFDFSIQLDLPERLVVFATLEAGWTPPSPGFADRFEAVRKVMASVTWPAMRISLAEPLSLFPSYWQHLLQRLQAVAGITLLESSTEEIPTASSSDLHRFLSFLENGNKPKTPLQGDGSLVLVQGDHDSELGIFVSKLIADNPNWKPVCLIPAKDRVLDIALTHEGQPALGVTTTSLARPLLQVLKLAPAFLWQPLNPAQVMEFVSLPLKPLHEELSYRIAQRLADTPGIGGEAWYGMVQGFFRELEEGGVDATQIRQQYYYWFERKRYEAGDAIPRQEVADLFSYIAHWAKHAGSGSESPGTLHAGLVSSLRHLASQAQQIHDLIYALPEEFLTSLEIERIIRTVYEAAPTQWEAAQIGHLPYVHQSGSLTEPTQDVLWWNFVYAEIAPPFQFWRAAELACLSAKGITLNDADLDIRFRQYAQFLPFKRARRSVTMVIPEKIGGKTQLAHPVMGYLEACFHNLSPICLQAGEENSWIPPFWNRTPMRNSFKQKHDSLRAGNEYLHYPSKPDTLNPEPNPAYQLPVPQPFIDLPAIDSRESESFTSLEALLYYPYKWLFRYKARLQPSPLLRILQVDALYGNLAHRFFEHLFEQPFLQWSKPELQTWMRQEFDQLLQREGAPMLLYGYEPERIRFRLRLEAAALRLIDYLQSDGWELLGVEVPLEGELAGTKLQARADLILKRGDERAIVDLKWKGANYRSNMIRNKEDLQLVLYSHLAEPAGQWAHTAYFIMQQGTMIARNNAAFSQVKPIDAQSSTQAINQQIHQAIERTYDWRKKQLQSGKIEVRCTQTISRLNEHYEQEDMLGLLEMKEEDARFDDYRVLIGLVG